jgi:hypothetical protein
MILNTIPVFGVVAAICFLGERLTWEQATGAAVILIAVFLFDEAQEPADLNQQREQPYTPPRRAGVAPEQDQGGVWRALA